MRTIAKLFGRSPFVPVQHHMQQVAACVEQLRPAMQAYLQGNQEEVEKLADRIAEDERAADTMRQDIQKTVKKGVFLAVDRSRLVKIVTLQDRLADKTGNIVRLMSLKECPQSLPFRDELEAFVEGNLAAFAAVRKIIDELDELLETSFGGAEAQLVRQLVTEVRDREREADDQQIALLKALFQHEEKLTHGQFYLWMRILKQTGAIADLSEALADRVQSVLELK
ncbi:MAG: TIGR00153 family protein [Phycisphaeraceae bacterium]